MGFSNDSQGPDGDAPPSGKARRLSTDLGIIKACRFRFDEG
jgi:hypothetical protein